MKQKSLDDSQQAASRQRGNTSILDAPLQGNLKLEGTGVKPIYKNVVWLDDEWWYVGCKDGGKRKLDSHIRKNKTRMFVNGKYIPKTHPLHKPGRYKTFEGAAFASLEGYINTTEG